MAHSTRTRFKIGDKLGTVFVVIIEGIPAAIYHLLIQFYGSKLPGGFDMFFRAERPVTWILPIFSLALGNIAYYAMWLRRYMVDENNKDYVKLARAEGRVRAGRSSAPTCSATPLSPWPSSSPPR